MAKGMRASVYRAINQSDNKIFFDIRRECKELIRAGKSDEAKVLAARFLEDQELPATTPRRSSSTGVLYGQVSQVVRTEGNRDPGICPGRRGR